MHYHYMLHSPATPDIPIEVDGLRKQNKGCNWGVTAPAISRFDWQFRAVFKAGQTKCCCRSSVCHFNLAWCRRSSRSMAAATSELYRCLRWCDDLSLRFSEQICMSSILIGNSLICTSWYLNCAMLIHSDSTAHKDQYAKTWFSVGGARSEMANSFVFFF